LFGIWLCFLEFDVMQLTTGVWLSLKFMNIEVKWIYVLDFLCCS